MKPIEAKSASGQQLSSNEIEQKVEVAPWRYGPAAYWYDQMGVNETGDKFDYGFKLKQVSIEPFLTPFYHVSVCLLLNTKLRAFDQILRKVNLENMKCESNKFLYLSLLYM